MPLIFLKVLLCVHVCISGLILSSSCFSFRLLRFQCHMESKSKLHNERSIIFCVIQMDSVPYSFHTLLLPCTPSITSATMDCATNINTHGWYIHATYTYWNVCVYLFSLLPLTPFFLLRTIFLQLDDFFIYRSPLSPFEFHFWCPFRRLRHRNHTLVTRTFTFQHPQCGKCIEIGSKNRTAPKPVSRRFRT